MQIQPVAAPQAAPLKWSRRSPAQRAALRQAWTNELAQARTVGVAGDWAGEWQHLERAHVLSQPMARAHVRTHLAMFSAAVRRRDRGEVYGQLMRVLLAGPGSLTGRYPVGNTGGSDVSAFLPMALPDDLRSIVLGEEEAVHD